MRRLLSFCSFAAACALGCGQAPATGPDGGFLSFGDAASDAASSSDAVSGEVDGGFPLPDGGVIAADRFVTGVVSFTPGDCAGFGATALPGIVEGPPVGAGSSAGSTDVVSLGVGGSIVLSFAPNAIVDGPGVDFVVFENAFYVNGDPMHPFADPGEVSVSDDGETWTAFPCDPKDLEHTQCAGWHPVMSSPENGISPFDVEHAGGDDFDLASIGVAHARYVKIRDVGTTMAAPNAGFDLDAIAVVNAGD